jgi:thiol:disulfide interchange protein
MNREMSIAMDEPTQDDGIVLTEAQKRARRSRSIAIAVSLGVLVALFYAMTLVKGPMVLIRPM